MENNWPKALKQANLKVTKKRLEILKVIETKNKSITPLEIYDELSKDYPGISYDTIYGNLKKFQEVGLLELSYKEEKAYYRLSCKGEKHHHHFHCTSCQKIFPIPNCPVTFFEKEFPNFKVSHHQWEVYGKCPDCLAKNL